jgi:hypothetical protein
MVGQNRPKYGCERVYQSRYPAARSGLEVQAAHDLCRRGCRGGRAGKTMNLPFIMVVCFGVLFLGIVIAAAIFNAKVGGSSVAAPWMGRVRGFQNEVENAGWRIQVIPYDDTSKPMTLSLNGVLAMVPVAGALGFLCGLALAVYDDRQHVKAGLILAVASWGVAMGGYWLKARGERQDWDVAPGRCVDRELRKVRLVGRGGGQWGWLWRIVCEYEYLGIPYRVTPEVYWSSFTSEEAARKFLEERISPKGECMLRLDPGNPLRTELLDQGIKDKLLY